MYWIDGIESWITITWWAVHILIAILIIRYFVRRKKHPEKVTALETLTERFAKGKIDQKEHISD